MRATPLLLGCLLGLSAIATAAANGSSIAGTLGSSAGSSYNCTHQSPEHSSNHDAVPSSGDALGVSHANTVPSSPAAHRVSTPNGSSESDVPHFGDDASPNHSAHDSGLSWQSLLPGSIQ